MARRAIGFAIAVAAALSSRRADAQNGLAGAACTSRAECGPAYRCVNEVCVDERKFRPTEPQNEQWVDAAPIGYVGASLGLSLPAVWNNVGEAFQLGLRLGTIIDKTFLLQLDVSPVTTVFTNITSSAFGMFDATGSLGFLIPLNDFTSWVVRIGGGGGAFIAADVAPIPFGEVRLDLFGVSIRTSKHVQIECQIPSFRLLFLTEAPFYNGNVALMWVTNVSLDYVF